MSIDELKNFALEAFELIDGNLISLGITKGAKSGKSRMTLTIAKYARESLAAIADGDDQLAG